MSTTANAGTFTPNKTEPIHRWYQYMEGYSSQLVERELDGLAGKDIHTIYDPFGGAGTTLLSSSMRGLTPYYSETNPFMSFVVRTKINCVMDLCRSPESFRLLNAFLSAFLSGENDPGSAVSVPDTWDGFEKYYPVKAFRQVLDIKARIAHVEDPAVRDILMLALSSILVPASKMIRRGDLRYARPSEKKCCQPVLGLFSEKLKEIITDIQESGPSVLCPVHPLAEDCRCIQEENLIDCVITSPPYLNGTNYIRNTKLELKLNDFVNRETDLPDFHSRGIVAGINNVSKRNHHDTILPQVQDYIDKLQQCSYDKRIPLMAANYFYDMNQVFSRLRQIMKTNSWFIMDIGDSQFAGVHIPTHQILAALCETHDFTLCSEDLLRTRHSKNGMKLSQRLLRFRLEK